MGFLRKAAFLGTGGMSGLVVHANSKKERAAKAAEKQLRLQRQQARLEAQAAKRAAANPPPAAPTPAVTTPLIADELRKLAELRDIGIISPAEFDTQKQKLLGAHQ